jgi:hypothetical protein
MRRANIRHDLLPKSSRIDGPRTHQGIRSQAQGMRRGTGMLTLQQRSSMGISPRNEGRKRR